MTDTLDPMKHDKRLIERRIKAGLIDRKDYDKRIDALPDLASQAMPVEATLEAVAMSLTPTSESEKEDDEE